MPKPAVSQDTVLQVPWDAAKTWLGSGYSISDGQARASPFMDQEKFTITEDDPTNPDVKYEHIMISNEEEYQQEIESSLKAKARIFGVGLKATFEQLRDIRCDSKSMTSVLRCSITHEPIRYIQRPMINSTASSLLKSDTGAVEFGEKYGDYFVAGYKKSSSLVAIITYTASNNQQKNEFKSSLKAGKGIASVDMAAGYMDNAKQHKVHCSVKWQSSGIDLSLLTTYPGPEDIERIFKQVATCKPKKQTALLHHYSLIDINFPRTTTQLKLLSSTEHAEAVASLLRLQNRAQQCRVVGVRDVQDQAIAIDQALKKTELLSQASKEDFAAQCGKLWRLERRLNLLLDGQTLIESAQRSARNDLFRDWHYPGQIRMFDFGAIGTHSEPIEGEVQHVDFQECRVHGKGFQRQENTISIWPRNALVVGFRVHSCWDDGTNGPFIITGGGVMQDHVDVRFRTREHKGGHWGVEVWYLDRAVYLPQPS